MIISKFKNSYVDYNRRKGANSFFLKRYYLKAIASNEFLSRRIRERAQHYLSASRYISKTKFNNHCKESHRSKSIVRSFQLSRHVFRKKAETGFLLGVRRSSW